MDLPVPPGRALARLLALAALFTSIQLGAVAQEPSPPARTDFEELAGIRAGLAQGDRDRARAALAELLAGGVEPLLEGHGDGDSIDLLVALANLAGQLGDLQAQLAVRESLVAIRLRHFPADDPDVLRSQGNLAVTRANLGDIEGAHELFELVHAAWVRQLEPDDPELLGARANLATSRKVRGDLQGALALEEALLVAQRTAHPADHPAVVRAEGNLAGTLAQLGELERAHALLEHVYAVRARTLPPDDPQFLRTMQNLAATRIGTGDVEGAHALLERSLAGRLRLYPEDHPDVLIARGHLAVTMRLLGDIEGGLALEEQVLAGWLLRLDEDHPEVLSTKTNVGAARYAAGDYQGAHELFEEVYAARAALLVVPHPALLGAMQNLALTTERLGDLEGALELEQRVLDGWRQVLPAGDPGLQDPLCALASTRYRSGQVERAVENTRALLENLARGALRDLARSPREARASTSQALANLARARFLCTADEPRPGLDAPTFAALETLRHVVTAPRGAGLIDPGLETVARRAELERAERQLGDTIARGPRGPEGGAGADWRAQIHEAALLREAALNGLLREIGTGDAQPIEAAAVAGALPEGALAIGVTHLYRWQPLPEAPGREALGSHYLASVLRSDGGLRTVDLGPAEQLESLITAWRSALGRPVERGVRVEAERASAELRAGRALRAALIDPLLAAAGDRAPGSAVHLCLDDALHLVPIDALPLDEGAEQERLGDVVDVHLELSFARLLAAPRPFTTVATGAVVVVGGVDFSAELDRSEAEVADLAASTLETLRDGERTSPWGEWEPLFGTADEARDVVALARAHLAPGASGEVEPVVLSGADVTEEALEQAVRGARYVHLATHGWFMPASIKSMLDREPAAGTPLDTRATVTGFAPLTLCGLVLSGANTAEDAAQLSARLLTALELSSFDLRECDLAVLSACETNVGVRRAGQGLQSLRTALHAAGARSSITSLWTVSDHRARELMKRFYGNLWGREMDKATALWEAKRALRAAGHPPRDWAGWVLTGAPR